MLQRIKIFLLLLLLCSSNAILAKGLPQTDGDFWGNTKCRARYSVQIDFKKAYISGICSMIYDNGVLKASIVNEFGVSTIDFIFDHDKDKVKIVHLINKLDHWYIKRLLKKDIRELIHNLQKGDSRYEDTKYNITYTFIPLIIDEAAE